MKPSGAASFIVQYRTKAGRTRRLAIGRKGTLTPEQARNLARDTLVEVAKGGDPSAERRKIRKSITVAELCDLYLKEAEGNLKRSTINTDRNRIEVHVKPLIGSHPVASVTAEDLEQLQSDIASGKTARPRRKQGRGISARGGRGVASRTLGMLGAILELAKRRKLIKQNSARGVKRFPGGRQRRYLSLDEITALGAACKQAAEAGEGATALAAIKFLLLTGLRRTEALALPRTCVDMKAHCIRFYDTKTGPQIRPIGYEAVKLVRELPGQDGRPWVSPAGRGDGHLVGLPKALDRVCKRAGIKGITPHVLRHSFAATAAGMGYSELTIVGLLGHSVPGITARYAHVPDAALLAAADKVSARIAAALDGRLEESGQIVPLRRA
jgi:integrase